VKLRAALILLLTLALASCQTAPPPAAEAKPATYGDWTVKTSGYVRAESGVVK
jgi:hypothetical protein